jgi:hypothetical protein
VYAVSISFVIPAKAHPIHHGRQSAWAAATLAAISGDGGAEGVAPATRNRCKLRCAPTFERTSARHPIRCLPPHKLIGAKSQIWSGRLP